MSNLKDKLLKEETFDVIKRSIESVKTSNESKIKRIKKRRKKRKKSDSGFKVKKGKVVYIEYISSSLWNKRRFAYFKKHKKQCAICKTYTNITLHHMTYKNIGCERDDELVALCWTCHKSYHKVYKNPSIPTTKYYIKEQRVLINQIREIEEHDNHMQSI